MRIGAGATGGRRVFVGLLLILVPLAAGLVPADGWLISPSEPIGDDEQGGHPTWSGAVGSFADVAAVASPELRLARLSLGDDPVASGWIALTQTDRAPPRA